MAGYRRLQVSVVGDVTVVRFNDHKIIDDVNIQELGQELFQLIEAEGRKKLLLNFSSVDFLSSAALGKLITLDKKVKAHSGVLRLSNISAGDLRGFHNHQAQSPVRHQGRRSRRPGCLLTPQLFFAAAGRRLACNP